MAGKRRKLGAKPTKHHFHPQPPENMTAKPQHQQNKKRNNDNNKAAASKSSDHRQKSHEKPTIPFDKEDRILLIGEGDLSFAASLVTHHGCRNVVATVLEGSEQELLEKYPHARANMDIVMSPPKQRKQEGKEEEKEGDDEHDEHDDEKEEDGEKEKDEEEEKEDEQPAVRNKIIYNTDATKPFPSSLTRPPPNRIFFNFPHVGGKSTDVNRQVRYNQSLLVSFFRHALAALAPRGTIVVTLFEGEPYTLWNPRDLARHAGLQVEKSFRFQAGAYPGYRHARTLGVVRGKDGTEGAGWKGEERAARSYVFFRKGDDEQPWSVKGRLKRRRAGDSDSDDDGDGDGDGDDRKR